MSSTTKDKHSHPLVIRQDKQNAQNENSEGKYKEQPDLRYDLEWDNLHNI